VTKRDKLVQRILKRPPDFTFGGVRSLLEESGWTHASTKGSHARFTKDGKRSITVPIHNGKVKRVYLDQICQRLKLDAETETD
jgi:predicted RNA binding protein YcfA (HicA-like mRNA interferase family)